jgi:hypothetical protein
VEVVEGVVGRTCVIPFRWEEVVETSNKVKASIVEEEVVAIVSMETTSVHAETEDDRMISFYSIPLPCS